MSQTLHENGVATADVELRFWRGIFGPAGVGESLIQGWGPQFDFQKCTKVINNGIVGGPAGRRSADSLR
jgi:hypothetical protein